MIARAAAAAAAAIVIIIVQSLVSNIKGGTQTEGV
jgi:hypothetical protein